MEDWRNKLKTLKAMKESQRGFTSTDKDEEKTLSSLQDNKTPFSNTLPTKIPIATPSASSSSNSNADSTKPSYSQVVSSSIGSKTTPSSPSNSGISSRNVVSRSGSITEPYTANPPNIVKSSSLIQLSQSKEFMSSSDNNKTATTSKSSSFLSPQPSSSSPPTPTSNSSTNVAQNRTLTTTTSTTQTQTPSSNTPLKSNSFLGRNPLSSTPNTHNNSSNTSTLDNNSIVIPPTTSNSFNNGNSNATKSNNAQSSSSSPSLTATPQEKNSSSNANTSSKKTPRASAFLKQSSLTALVNKKQQAGNGSSPMSVNKASSNNNYTPTSTNNLAFDRPGSRIAAHFLSSNSLVNSLKEKNNITSFDTSTPSTEETTNAAPTFSSQAEEYKYKYEQEVKKRIDMEHRLREKIREANSLKNELQKITAPLATNNNNAQNANWSLTPAGLEKKVRGSGKFPKGGNPPKTARITVEVSNQLTSFLDELARIEKTILASEAARASLEDRLYEICTQKLMADAVFKRVLEKQMESATILQSGIQQIQSVSISVSKDAMQKSLKTIVESYSIALNEGGLELLPIPSNIVSTANSALENENSTTPTQTSLVALNVPHPPPLPTFPNNPPQRSKNLLPPTNKDSFSNLSNSESGVTDMMEQIRAGVSLNRIDLAILQKERERTKREGRRSMKNLKSLAETLREVLMARAEDIYMDDDDEGEEDENDGEWLE